MQPFISHFIPTNLQSLPDPNRPDRSLFPKQAQAVTVFDEQGTPKEEFRSRLQPTESETPRWTRVQNGSCIEIDNRGNINLQSTIARDKIQKERYSNYDYSKAEIKETPDPQGNVVVSTRGARKGNIGLITGKIKTTELRKTLVVFDAGETREIEVIVREALDETNEDGSILLQTSFAKKGNVTYDLRDAEQGNYQVLTGKLNGQIEPPGNITLKTLNALLGSILLRTQSKEGNITLDTESSEKGDILCRTAKAKSGKVTITTELAEDGTILLKDKKGSFIKLDTVTGNIEIEAAQEIIFRATKIRGIQK